MFSLTNVLIAVCSLLIYFLYTQKKKYEFWKERNVPHVGFKRDLLFNVKKHRSLSLQDIYDEFPSHHYVGFYQGGKPYLLVRDLDLIRNILVKDFAHFTDHAKVFNTENDPLIRETLFFLEGQRWKDVRTRLSPIFSTGKLRQMSSLMDECAKILDRHLELTLAKSDEIEVRELMQKFSMDVIGICAFGLNCNAVIDEQSAFRRVAQKLFSPGSQMKFILMILASSISSRIISWFKIKMIDKEVEDFFYLIMRDTMINREKTAMKRDDFVQLLINVRAEEEKKMIESKNYETGMRFAIVEMKAALSRIIESYSVHPSPKTEIPVVPNPRYHSCSPTTLYLRFQKR